MRKIRKCMWAVARKGRLLKDIYGAYIMFDKRTDALNQFPDAKVVKITLTIQPEE